MQACSEIKLPTMSHAQSPMATCDAAITEIQRAASRSERMAATLIRVLVLVDEKSRHQMRAWRASILLQPWCKSRSTSSAFKPDTLKPRDRTEHRSSSHRNRFNNSDAKAIASGSSGGGPAGGGGKIFASGVAGGGTGPGLPGGQLWTRGIVIERAATTMMQPAMTVARRAVDTSSQNESMSMMAMCQNRCKKTVAS